jgi:hypothetical protein
MPLSTEQPAPRNKVSRPSRKALRSWRSGVLGIRLLIVKTSTVKIAGWWVVSHLYPSLWSLQRDARSKVIRTEPSVDWRTLGKDGESCSEVARECRSSEMPGTTVDSGKPQLWANGGVMPIDPVASRLPKPRRSVSSRSPSFELHSEWQSLTGNVRGIDFQTTRQQSPYFDV